ncbi:Copper chaperone for superoxide dismutase [Acipenser ruthenus]|uniref:Copper chaperone for superoxide dismutase n=1 Tax=Acipenser ruthenus TaxID=7906 RepID=A0A444UZW9_ACIRT|nr:Copper chaperone for superoxide dismutase [Acipenser ruthenus]
MTCGSCSSAVRNALQGAPGVQSVEIDLQREEVLVDTTLTSQEVQDLIEKTGRRAVLKGVGSPAQKDLGAAVAMLSGSNLVQGHQAKEVQRLLATDYEGTMDGLEPGPHGLHVHEFGDLTDDCLRSWGKLPDDWKVEDPTGEDCALLSDTGLYDVSCGKKYECICEKVAPII